MDMETTSFEEAIASDLFRSAPGYLPFLLGYDDDCNLITDDFSRIQHMLIAGFSGSGKSTLAHSIILSLAHRSAPDKLRFLFADTKMIEFSVYNDLPHLLAPISTEVEKITGEIVWVHAESLRRLELFANSKVTNISDYNNYAWEHYTEELPHIVVVIDDIAKVLAEEGISDIFRQLVQNGRVVGIHILMITQTPGAKNLTDLVKNSIPARIVCGSLSAAEERRLLDRKAKVPALDVGQFSIYDFFSHTCSQLNSYDITVATIHSVLAEMSARYHPDQRPNQLEAKDLFPQQNPPEESNDAWMDSMIPLAVEAILETGIASISMLQRRLRLGYARSARILDALEEKGIIGAFQGDRPREIFVTRESWKSGQFVLGQCLSQKDPSTPPYDESTAITAGIKTVEFQETHNGSQFSNRNQLLHTLRKAGKALSSALYYIIAGILAIPIALSNDPKVDKPNKAKTITMWIGISLIVAGLLVGSDARAVLLILGFALVLITGVTAIRWIGLAVINALLSYTCASHISTGDLTAEIIGAIIFFAIALSFAWKVLQRIRKNLAATTDGTET